MAKGILTFHDSRHRSLNRFKSKAKIVPSYLTNILARNRRQDSSATPTQNAGSYGGFGGADGQGNVRSNDNGLRSLSNVSPSNQMEKSMAPTAAMSAPSTAANGGGGGGGSTRGAGNGSTGTGPVANGSAPAQGGRTPRPGFMDAAACSAAYMHLYENDQPKFMGMSSSSANGT